MKIQTRSAIFYATVGNAAGLIVTLALEIVHRAVYHESHYLPGAALFGAATLIGVVWLAYKHIGK